MPQRRHLESSKGRGNRHRQGSRMRQTCGRPCLIHRIPPYGQGSACKPAGLFFRACKIQQIWTCCTGPLVRCLEEAKRQGTSITVQLRAFACALACCGARAAHAFGSGATSALLHTAVAQSCQAPGPAVRAAPLVFGQQHVKTVHPGQDLLLHCVARRRRRGRGRGGRGGGGTQLDRQEVPEIHVLPAW